MSVILYQFDVYACETTYPYNDVAKLTTVTVPVVEGNLTPVVSNVSFVDIGTALTNASAHTQDIGNLGNGIGHRTGSFDEYMQALIDIAPRTQVIADIFDNYKSYCLKIKNSSGYYGVSSDTISYYGKGITYLYDKNGQLVTQLFGNNGLPFVSNNNISNIVVEKIDGDKLSGDTCSIIGIGVNGSGSDITYNVSHTYNINKSVLDWFNGLKAGVITDPYKGGGSTGTGGGGGTFGGGTTIFGGNTDSIDVPPLPTASASSAGFITLFNPSLAQLNNLANYMWSDLFSLDTFKKIFADPMDCILGLSIVPVKPASAGNSTVKIGNVSTDVSMNKTSSQYVAVDCGTIDVKEYWGAYLDYAPYTQCEIYLPYVGTKQISVDDVMNKAVHVVYHVDILSGACNAYVKCGDSVLYTFVGQCSSSIPISGNDWTNVLNGAISVAGKIGLAIATGGATALMSGLGAASSIISSSKPTVERSGAMSSTGGLLGIQKPYLILTRPKQALPENQNKYTGYPSFITMALSDCTGYTEIDSVHLENMSCTDEETQEIENLLKSGVIF